MLIEALKIINVLFDDGYVTRHSQHRAFGLAPLTIIANTFRIADRLERATVTRISAPGT